MNRPLTIAELMRECMKQVTLGNGDKEIYISADDEGNEFHALYYLFTDNSKGDITAYKNMGCMRDCKNEDNVILLG